MRFEESERARRDSSVHVTEPDERSTSWTIREMRVLRAATLVAETGARPDATRELVQDFLSLYVPKTHDEEVIVAAMQLIAGEPIVALDEPRPRRPWEAYVSDVTGCAWVDWARGKTALAAREIRRLRKHPVPREPAASRSGAIHLLALYFWGEAILQLSSKNRKSAHKFYRRALELGSQFGTESHPVISWTYAATFFSDGAQFKK